MTTERQSGQIFVADGEEDKDTRVSFDRRVHDKQVMHSWPQAMFFRTLVLLKDNLINSRSNPYLCGLIDRQHEVYHYR